MVGCRRRQVNEGVALVTSSSLCKEVEGAGFPFQIESLEDGVDDAVHTFYVHKAHHRSGSPSHFHEATLDHVGGAQFAPQVPGERRRTTATPVSPVPAVAPPRRTAAASGRRSCEKRFRLCPALPPDKWPALRSLLPHGLTSALSPGCCASYAPSNADVVPADTPSESPPPNPHSHP